ncbi:NACHT domain-containing protein [Glycomyces harbinensis]|uniref:NACHT domain-containing protein n=2 Tax=Glycomyces harbinensis TaxID=58114 RepID=A0A1G6QUV5_9ACTN|nr:NACHT domain-containing protein [Glycomyces harbinensis]
MVRALQSLEFQVRDDWRKEARDRGLAPAPIRVRLTPSAVTVDDRREQSTGQPDVPGVSWLRTFNRLNPFDKGATGSRGQRDLHSLAAPIIDARTGGTVTIDEIGEEWRRDCRKRFVILGAPGSGKTSVLVNLLCDILSEPDRTAGDPVPVLVTVTGWDPNTPFPDWLEARLKQDYPHLAQRSHQERGRRNDPSLAAVLIATGKIIPLLDGLDEIADQDRQSRVIAELNKAAYDVPLALTCRTTEYRVAVNRGEFTHDAKEYELQPLDVRQAAAYLRGGERTPASADVAAGRWESVISELGRGGPLAEALSTPLMVYLARTAYEGTHARPSELIELPTRKAIEQRLAAAYLPAVYQRTTRHRQLHGRRLDDAMAAMQFFARHLRDQGTTDLAWWELHRAIHPARLKIIQNLWFVLIGGLMCGLVYVFWGEPVTGFAGVLAGIYTGVLAAALVFRGTSRTVETPRSFQFSQRGLIVALTLGLAFGLAVGFAVGPATGIIVGSVVGLGFGATGSLRTRSDLRNSTVGPRRTLRSDQIGVLIPDWLLIGILSGLAGGHALGFAVSFAFGFPGGFAYRLRGRFGTASGTLMHVSLWLRLTGSLPWGVRILPALEDAKRRHVLRQVGAVYQFRHLTIQEHLAQQPDHP